MTERDQETGDTLPPDEFVPGEDEFEEEEEAFQERAREARAAAPRAPGRRWFGLRGPKEEPAPELADTVRGAHAERVRIDDRASALFALICAGGLIAILVGSFAATHLPKGPIATLAPLSIYPQASSSGSVLPSGSVVATPTASPTVSPTPAASPSPVPSAS
jgi:hypothetical protein